MIYPLKPPAIRRVQSRLAQLGIYKGKIDGVFGPETLRSLRGFQSIHGLKPDGVIGQLTEAELFPAIMPGGRREVAKPQDEIGVPIVWPYERDVEKFYGPKGTSQTQMQLPYSMRLAWDLQSEITHISLHEAVAPSASRVFARIAKAYTASERINIGLDLYGGSFNVRKKRGGTGWSMHSWGIAIDFDPQRNMLKMHHDKARLAEPDAAKFFSLWIDEGWVSLGKSRDFDWMHVQAARLG